MCCKEVTLSVGAQELVTDRSDKKAVFKGVVDKANADLFAIAHSSLLDLEREECEQSRYCLVGEGKLGTIAEGWKRAFLLPSLCFFYRWSCTAICCDSWIGSMLNSRILSVVRRVVRMESYSG